MYHDPKRVKQHRVTTNLDEYEFELLEAFAKYTGPDKSTLIRQMLMREATTLLMGDEVQATGTTGQ